MVLEPRRAKMYHIDNGALQFFNGVNRGTSGSGEEDTRFFLEVFHDQQSNCCVQGSDRLLREIVH